MNRYATEHRCGVVVSGPGLSGNISGSDPLKDHRLLLKVKPLDDTKEAAHTANVVNELSDVMRGILRHHPLNAERKKQGKAIANIVLLRGCGIRIEVTRCFTSLASISTFSTLIVHYKSFPSNLWSFLSGVGLYDLPLIVL